MFKNYSAALFFILSLIACTKHTPPLTARRIASGITQPPVEQGESWATENDSQTDEIISVVQDMLLNRSKDEAFIRRDAHPKHHGCVKAFFHVDSSKLPSELRVGVFAPEMASSFPAWIRFSNGNPDGAHHPDMDKDIRGMAVKLMNVQGAGSQDFVMLTSKEFFSENGDDYLQLHRALNSSGFALPWYLITHLNQARILFTGQVKATNPLALEYFSSVPYKLGSTSMKFKAKPCAANDLHDVLPDGTPDPDFLKARLVSTLASKGTCFDFFVQPNQDPAQNNIENATITWEEEKSPYIKVATVTIPQQFQIDSPGQLNFCENLSFDPWHSLSATRPLGQINRMRLKIYSTISEFRHAYNHIPMLEPTTHEACSGDTAVLCQTPKH